MNPFLRPDWRPKPLFDIQSPDIPTSSGQAQKQRGKGGTLTSLISEGGALGGAAAGAAAGSVVPVIGTAIGGILGAGIGALGGRLAENKIRDDRWGAGDAAKEAALSSLLAGPLKLGKYAASAGKGLKAGAGLEKALMSGADDAAKFTVRGALGNKALNKADDLAIKGFKFTPSQLTNFKKKFGEDASQVISRNGLVGSSPDDFMEAIGKQQSRFDELVNTAGTIKKADVESSLKSAYSGLLKSAPSDTKKLGKQVKGEVDGLLGQFGDEISAPELNSIRRMFDDLVNYTNKQADPARYGVNKRIADSIRKTIQKASGSDELKTTGQEINKLRQLADSVAMQSNRGRGANPLGLGTLLAGGVGFGGAGVPGAVATAAGAKFINSPTALRAGSKGLSSVGGKLTNSANKISPVRGAMTGALRGVGGEGLAEAIMGAQAQSLNSNPMIPPTMNSPTSVQNMGSQYSNTGQMSNPFAEQGGVPQSMYSLENAIMDVQRDPENAEYYMKLFEFANPEPAESATPKPLGGEARNRALKAQSGLVSLDTLEQTLASDPGAFQRQALPNPLGLTARVTGTTDVRAATDNLVDIIARLRSGAAITDSEAKRFSRFLPLPGDSQESAQRKLQTLRMELESYLDPNAGESSLEDALLAYQ